MVFFLPLSAQRLLGFHRVLLRLKAKVLNIQSKMIVKPLPEGVGQGVLGFFCGRGIKKKKKIIILLCAGVQLNDNKIDSFSFRWFLSSPLTLPAGTREGGAFGLRDGESSWLWWNRQRQTSSGEWRPPQKTQRQSAPPRQSLTWISAGPSSAPARYICCAPSPAPVSATPCWIPL